MVEQTDFRLYHYTTPEGLRGIIKDMGIWATSIFFLNDSAEWYLGMRRFAKRLKDRINTRGDHSILDLCLGAVKSAVLGEQRGGLAPERNLAMYVCSFSTKPNRLSQWRAYCPKGGFAIGFLKSELKPIVEDQGFTLEHVYTVPTRRTPESMRFLMTWRGKRRRLTDRS